MWNVLKNLLNGQNQFASGGLLLMVVGGLIAYLRSIPQRIWRWIVDQSTITITVTNDDAAFTWVKEWLLEQKFLKRVRRVDLDTTVRNARLALIPAPGRHWFWHANRPFFVYFYRHEETKGWTPRRTESLTFMTVGRKQSLLREFVSDVIACHEKNMRVCSSLFIYDEGWTRIQGYMSRSLDSVILSAGVKEDLLSDVERFRASESRYRQLGVPYHRGYLFYGPPGTGKTTLASALAEKFDMSIYAVNLNDFTDRSLMGVVNDIPPKSVVLFEDIDCMKSGRARDTNPEGKDEKNNPRDKGGAETSSRVTLSGLLNVLDGFHAPDSVLFVMTSNRIEDLDAALLRPGRIDYRLYLGKADVDQKIELYKRFFPERSEFEALEFVDANFAAETMAEFQGLLLALENDGLPEPVATVAEVV
jgi:mitochondrial chaperone BCS1